MILSASVIVTVALFYIAAAKRRKPRHTALQMYYCPGD
jgi:hypothetical protein